MHSLRRILVVPLLLAAAVPAAQAQPWLGGEGLEIQAEGRRGRAIAGAEVILRYLDVQPSGGPRPVATDRKGRAVVGSLASGRWEIEVSHPDYLTYVGVVVLASGRRPTVATAFLEATGASLTPLKVKFSRAKGASSPPLPMPAAPAAAQPDPPRPEPVEPAAPQQPVPEAVAVPPQPQPSAAGLQPAPDKPGPAPQEVVAAAPEIPAAPVPVPPAPTTEPPGAEPTAPEPAAPEPAAPEPESMNADPEPSLEPAAPVPAPAPLPESPEPPIEPVATREAQASDPPAPSPAEPAAPDPAVERAPQPVAPPARAATPEAPAAPEPTLEFEVIRPEGSVLRSYRDRTCVECRPGEWAVSAETVAGPPGGPCPVWDDEPGLAAAMDLLGSSVELELAGHAGPVAPGIEASALDVLPADRATRILEHTRRFWAPASACRVLGTVLPRGATFVGFRLEAWDGEAAGDCVAGSPCPIGRARWPQPPEIVRGANATAVMALFENQAETPRRARLTVYFIPPSRSWR